MALNTSIFALPIYWIVVIATRFYTVLHLKRNAKAVSEGPNTAAGGTSLTTNANPHSSATYDLIRASLSPAAYARWERIQAAHRNGMENMALFYSSVILGNIARLSAAELNACAWIFVGARIAYVFFYIVVESERASNGRSACYGIGLVLCMWLLFRSAVFIMRDYEALHYAT